MSESFRHLWGRTDDATPPTPDPRERGEALLPCPFCGGAAEFERVGTKLRSCIVVCTECGARHESGDTINSGASWNRRAALRAPAPSEAVAWLIEKPQPGGVYWWHGKRHALAAINEDYNPDHFPSAIAYEFGPVAAEAVRFNSREDADVVIRRFPPQWRSVLIASEHMWVSAHPAPAPSEAVAWMVEFKRPDESDWQKSGPHFSYAEAEQDQTRLLLRHWPAHIVPLYTHPAPARGVTGEMREAIMSAIEQAVASCVEQAGKRLPTEAWHVDYAGILDRVTDAMYTPDAEGGA